MQNHLKIKGFFKRTLKLRTDANASAALLCLNLPLSLCCCKDTLSSRFQVTLYLIIAALGSQQAAKSVMLYANVIFPSLGRSGTNLF